MKKCLSALLALLALALPLGAVAQELEVMVIDGAAAPVEEQQLTTESAIRIPDDCIIDGQGGILTRQSAKDRVLCILIHRKMALNLSAGISLSIRIPLCS